MRGWQNWHPDRSWRNQSWPVAARRAKHHRTIQTLTTKHRVKPAAQVQRFRPIRWGGSLIQHCTRPLTSLPSSTNPELTRRDRTTQTRSPRNPSSRAGSKSRGDLIPGFQHTRTTRSRGITSWRNNLKGVLRLRSWRPKASKGSCDERQGLRRTLRWSTDSNQKACQPKGELNHFVVVAAERGAHASNGADELAWNPLPKVDETGGHQIQKQAKTHKQETRQEVHTGKIQPTDPGGRQPTKSQVQGCCSAQDNPNQRSWTGERRKGQNRHEGRSPSTYTWPLSDGMWISGVLTINFIILDPVCARDETNKHTVFACICVPFLHEFTGLVIVHPNVKCFRIAF